MNLILDEMHRNDSSWADSTLPDVEQIILGLVDEGMYFSTPFDLNEHIKQTLVRAAEEAGSDRMIDWSLSTFERIGGSNVLRNVWLLLKNSHRTRGEK